MFEQQPKNLRQKVKSLSAKFIEQQDPSGWFESLYSEAKGDSTQVPWAKNEPHPYLQQWSQKYTSQGEGNSALVIGCGLGDDAEFLANLGYQVTAFDISPTAIAWCNQRFPESQVSYQIRDLLNLDLSWHKFDLVFECRNIQALPLDVRSSAISAIAPLVKESGTLLVITRHRDHLTIPEGPPWALSDAELSQFAELGLQEISRDVFWEGEGGRIKQLRVEYHCPWEG